MGLTQSKNNTESINWDNLDTDAMSSTLPAFNKISKDAEHLISQLNVENSVNIDYEDTESDSGNIFTWLKSIGDEDKETKPEEVANEDNFSDTSPFISSDMYKYLMDKNSEEGTSSIANVQKGGVIKDDSTTSTTSSSNRKDKKPKKNNKFTESSVMSGGDLSYISSSAHTENASSDDEVNTSISVGNNRILTSSINTSDINLVSANSN
jgi:hypothetical protein